MKNPCIDCISLAICCHMKSAELMMKCDKVSRFLLEGQTMEIEHDTLNQLTKYNYQFSMPKYFIKLNQENIDIVHSYFKKVKALGI